MKILLQNKYLLDFLAAVMFFTRIPINWQFFSNKPPNLTEAAWCFPLIGSVIGIISGILGDICLFFNLPIFLSCTIAITLSVIITGAFHEDGLADMADGFGAGGLPEKVNKIMHDSRLGTYGTVALILGLLIRLGLVVSLVELGYSIMAILAFSFASGKLSIIFIRNFFNVSSFSKTGSIIENVSTKNWLVATILWFVPLPFIFPFWAILFGFILNFCTIFIIGKMSQRKLNGITGDILGATAFTTELVFLFGLTIYLRSPF